MKGRKRLDDGGSGSGGSSGDASRRKQKLSRERELKFGGKIPKKVRGNGKKNWSKSEPWEILGENELESEKDMHRKVGGKES